MKPHFKVLFLSSPNRMHGPDSNLRQQCVHKANAVSGATKGSLVACRRHQPTEHLGHMFLNSFVSLPEWTHTWKPFPLKPQQVRIEPATMYSQSYNASKLMCLYLEIFAGRQLQTQHTGSWVTPSPNEPTLKGPFSVKPQLNVGPDSNLWQCHNHRWQQILITATEVDSRSRRSGKFLSVTF